jgi:hypothetical protein
MVELLDGTVPLKGQDALVRAINDLLVQNKEFSRKLAVMTMFKECLKELVA